MLTSTLPHPHSADPVSPFLACPSVALANRRPYACVGYPPPFFLLIVATNYPLVSLQATTLLSARSSAAFVPVSPLLGLRCFGSTSGPRALFAATPTCPRPRGADVVVVCFFFSAATVRHLPASTAAATRPEGLETRPLPRRCFVPSMFHLYHCSHQHPPTTTRSECNAGGFNPAWTSFRLPPPRRRGVPINR